jgi:hypothetical protein
VIGWWVATAAAQQTCISPVSLMQIGAELGEIRKSVEVKDVVDVRVRLDRVTERLPCVDDVLPTSAWAEYAQSVAIAYFYRQEEDEMVRWAHAAAWADPSLAWPASVPAEHPLRRMLADNPVPAPSGPADRYLAPPKGGGVFVDGRLAERPEAPLDVPVFVQVFDEDRERVGAWFQNGPAFPSAWLSPTASSASPPAWWGTPATSRAPKPKPVREGGGGGGVAVAPVVAGSVLLVGSGVSYLLAAQAAASMPDLSSAELTGARTRANALVLVSGVTLAGGLGAVGGGLLLAAPAGVTVRF